MSAEKKCALARALKYNSKHLAESQELHILKNMETAPLMKSRKSINYQMQLHNYQSIKRHRTERTSEKLALY